METMINHGDLILFVYNLGPAYEYKPHAMFSWKLKRYLHRDEFPPLCLIRS